MINKNDYEVLDTYFKSLTTIPEELTVIVSKIDKINIMNKTQDELLELMKDGE